MDYSSSFKKACNCKQRLETTFPGNSENIETSENTLIKIVIVHPNWEKQIPQAERSKVYSGGRQVSIPRTTRQGGGAMRSGDRVL